MSETLDPRIADAAAEAKALAETLLAEGWEGQDGLTYFVISVISEPRMRSDYLLLLSEALTDFADVLEQNEPLAERCSVTVETHLAEVPALYADRDDLLRIFGNLVSNAIKYNHPGGTVTISSRNQGDRLWVEVADTGLGIPPEAVARLGEEFFRVNSPERRNIVGTGLGLSLVKRTLDACGGSLRIESTPGERSHFTVLLPWK